MELQVDYKISLANPGGMYCNRGSVVGTAKAVLVFEVDTPSIE